MAFHQGLVPLRNILAELYPAPGLARTVVAEAGIAEQLIDFGGAAVEFWQAILTVADNQRAVQVLIEVVRGHFPQNERLLEVEQFLQQTLLDSSPALIKEIANIKGEDGAKDLEQTTINVDSINYGVVAGRDAKNIKVQQINHKL